jgi:hypothetical protein
MFKHCRPLKHSCRWTDNNSANPYGIYTQPLGLLKEKFCAFAKRFIINPEIKNFIINTLSAYDPEMIGVFGSYARNENTVESDIDILVRFKSTLSLLQLVHVENLMS